MTKSLGQKAANMAIDPGTLGTTLGGLAGALTAGYIKEKHPNAGFALPILAGTIPTFMGNVIGRHLGAQQTQQRQRASAMPAGAPYAIDPTSEDIPPWALAGAQFFSPALSAGKTGSAGNEHEGLRDVVLGDIMGPLYPAMEGYRAGGMPGVGKHLLGSSLGIAAGGLLGHGLGQMLPQGNLWGIPISTLTSGLGATIGGVKGLQVARQGLGALHGG